MLERHGWRARDAETFPTGRELAEDYLAPLAALPEIAGRLRLLVVVPGIAAACIVLYGMGSGIRSIARGTVPLAMFGREGYAILMGRVALPTLLTTAAAPMIGTWLLGWVGPTGTLAVLFGAALLHVALVLPLVPMALRRRDRPPTRSGVSTG